MANVVGIVSVFLLLGCTSTQTWHDKMIQDMCFDRCPECCINTTAKADDGGVCIEENQDLLEKGWTKERIEKYCEGLSANL